MPRRTSGRAVRRPVGIFVADVRVLRLYPDGTVLDVLVKPAPGPGQAAAIARWLRPDNPMRGVHRGTYSLRGKRLSFTTRGHLHDGPVTVNGMWRGDELLLDITDGGRTVKARRFRRIDSGSLR
ncbi:hypothetical protein SAMN06297387_102216 [Streptomyces zhaozhouensis]|uniref:Uncharacterized protein n=1 Tax=Streptomyces zhaozhouensis TaxID=1300267 RepID=A0A286DPV6_9ACTN|nr:hypothetical protein [Streptomyces zhaozhouensis]SOD60686.1 hypothetical protein SAMN06297387_102216 [Streptomyces zhaozhouensis]